MGNFRPAVSVIIPMYNTEKYIGELLDSILSQTFQDYEVIVVDDCSKDNSAEIVQNYIQKFNGKLQLLKLDKNSGGASKPRNEGMKIARGEYLYFMDSDDLLTPSALEIMYNSAKKFNADIVYQSRHSRIRGENLNKKIIRGNDKELKLVGNPAVKFLDGAFIVMPWAYLFRRELILKNKIEFPNLFIGEDRFFVFCATCYVEKILCIPDICYRYRLHSASISTRKISAAELFERRTDAALSSSKFVEEFVDKHIEFFAQNPEFKMKFFDKFIYGLMDPIISEKLNKKIPLQERLNITYKILEKVEDKTHLTAFLYNRIIALRVSWREKNAKLKELKKKNELLKKELDELKKSRS